MTRTKTCAAVIALILATSPAVRSQGEDEAFRDGLDAREKGRWGEVVTKMRQAAQADRRESTRKVKRGIERLSPLAGTAYVPYFFLGEAYNRNGDCAAALDAWSTSEQQGVVLKMEDRAGALRRGKAECELKGFLPWPKFDEAVAAARRQVSDANSSLSALNLRTGTAGSLFSADRHRQLEQASGAIKEAESKLASGMKSRAATEFTEVRTLTERAATVMSALSTELEAAIAARDAALGELGGIDRAIAVADALDGEIEGKKASLTSTLAGNREQGREALTRARRFVSASRSSNATASASAIADARRDAQSASTQFRQILDELSKIAAAEIERRYSQALRAARDMFTLVSEAFVTFDRRAAARAEKVDTTERKAIDRRVQVARRQLEAATKTGDAAGIEAARRAAEQARDQLNRLISAFGPLTLADRGVHQALERGSRLFLNGEYQQALEALTPAEPFPPTMPLLVHVHLFRAASYHALYLKGGTADASLRDRALAEAAEVRALEQGFEPDPRAFSPRFLEFFRGATTAGEAPAAPTAPVGRP